MWGALCKIQLWFCAVGFLASVSGHADKIWDCWPFPFVMQVKNTMLCPIIVLELELMPPWKHRGSFLHSVVVKQPAGALLYSASRSTRGPILNSLCIKETLSLFFSMFTTLLHEAICKFELLSVVRPFKENASNLVVCVLLLHPIRVHVCLCTSQNKLHRVICVCFFPEFD